ncbi:branched-chain amino acid ABC transporter permease/ATP-binding protein [Gordonia rhizosphera]|uniref:Putative ABC transporter ATP-binding protein n=1 Tax=Gordonia rhizosphera NBRC 16068 TaxID=1108045 RepID=K6WGZ2_9ACTN|nr:branched-chain amino acid ABC transporter permease/ATP-binding protein [Gordonia rhizosphera]GAB91422.1 putative ABC transporter ATP-binding protein [Gordonia rhizosphera NBRC 16068]
MTDHLTYLFLGLGNGAVYAAIGLALVMTFKSSGVVNFATGAVALYCAYTYALLRSGELMIPIPGLPKTVDLGQPLGVAPAMIISLIIAALLGMLFYALIFRPMRNASVVAKAVASIGLMLFIQSLIALRVGTDPVAVAAIIPLKTFNLGDTSLPTDRFWLAVIVIAIAVVATLVYRYTRFGVATEAAAESEKGAYLTGLSPDRIAFSNWALSSAIAGLGGILIAPLVTLNPIAYTLFIVPALAATLVGNFSSIWLTVVAGIVIGCLQSEAINLQTSYSWVPKAGVAEFVPLILILIFLVFKGRALPDRGAVIRQPLGRAPRPDRFLIPAVLGVVVAVIALLATAGSWRAAIVTTMIFGVLGLSQVVVTGFAGQISLAQLTLAGVGAFSVSVLNTHLGIPFPFAPIIAALFAGAIGLIVGLPALRVRGLPLTVVTLALAVFLEAFWFRNPSLNGGTTGSPIDDPRLFGMSLGIGSGEAYPRMGFAVLCLVVLLACALFVAWLRRSRLGMSMLAVRANERSAAATGINVPVVKLAGFGIAAVLAGLCGSLIGYQQTLATPDPFTVFVGITVFALIYTAGVTSVGGAILAGIMAPGGVFYLAFDRFINLGDYYTLISGVLLIITVMANPDGIASRLPRIPFPAVRIRRPVAVDTTGAQGETPQPNVTDHTALAIDGVGVRYGAVQAAEDVTLKVHEGEIVGLIGPNGAGKTTVIDAISGFAPATGTVVLDGLDLGAKRPHERSRAGLGRSFQDVELYDDLSAAENIAVGATNGGDDTRVAVLLAMLGLDEHSKTEVSSLSQGQRQLVSVARVLASKPKVALLDEPAAGLDTNESRWLGLKLRAACADGTAMLLVDHDMDLVLTLCDRVVVLDLGRVIATGTPAEIRDNPEVVRAYLGVPADTAVDLHHDGVPELMTQESTP